ncbi:MAG: hypothetical protein JWM82_3458 [Myxococcales bacterium]|nr:hypothetical protein [Myxococcales bacterium]
MSRRISVLAWVVVGAAFLGACEKEVPPLPPPPAVTPTPPPPADDAAAKPKMVANSDGLSLTERIAKRQAAEKKVADELAVQEHDRLVKADRAKLPLHTQVFAFITKTRAQYDALEKKLAGATDKEAAKADYAKLAGSLNASIVAMGKKMETIDPKGGNSNVTTDYDVMLNALATTYPVALSAAVEGDRRALDELKVDFDKRVVKISAWLEELKAKPKK